MSFRRQVRRHGARREYDYMTARWALVPNPRIAEKAETRALGREISAEVRRLLREHREDRAETPGRRTAAMEEGLVRLGINPRVRRALRGLARRIRRTEAEAVRVFEEVST